MIQKQTLVRKHSSIKNRLTSITYNAAILSSSKATYMMYVKNDIKLGLSCECHNTTIEVNSNDQNEFTCKFCLYL